MERRGLDLLSSIFLVCLLCFPWTVSKAQVNPANLNGTVTDPSGASVANAKVEVLETDTGFIRQTTTGDSGVYSISSLPVGKYNLTISRVGFKTYVETCIELFVGQTRSVDVQLQVGAAAARLEVRGQVQAVDSSNAEIAGVVQSRQVEDISLNGRNSSTLAMLAPGVVNLGGGGQRDLRFVGRGTDDNTAPSMASMPPASRSRTRRWVCACPFRWTRSRNFAWLPRSIPRIRAGRPGPKSVS